MYPLPIIKSRTVSRHRVGDYHVFVVTDCESTGLVNIAHAALVYVPELPMPLYAITAETSAPGQDYALCLYADRYEKGDSSPNYADLDKFTWSALHYISRRIQGEYNEFSWELQLRDAKREKVSTLETALRDLDPAVQPEVYALMQFQLGSALDLLNAVEGSTGDPDDTDKLNALTVRAIAAYDACLRCVSTGDHPQEYIESLASLGFGYFMLADSDFEAAAPDPAQLQKVVEYYEEALKADAEYPGVWSELGRGQSLETLGNACRDLGRMDQAFTYWRRAVEALEKSDAPKLADTVRDKIARYKEEQHRKGANKPQ